jgi:Holliday junction resolvase-like predicted endonuclease
MSSAFNPKEIKYTLNEILGKAVETVTWDTAKRFLELNPSYYDSKIISKFNVLLLRKKADMPLSFLKNAMNNLGAINFGSVAPEERKRTLAALEVKANPNLMFSFVKYSNASKREHILETADVSLIEMNQIIDLIIKHSIIGITLNFINNFRYLQK